MKLRESTSDFTMAKAKCICLEICKQTPEKNCYLYTCFTIVKASIGIQQLTSIGSLHHYTTWKTSSLREAAFNSN